MAVSLGMSLITFIAGLCLVIGSASAVEVAERELTKIPDSGGRDPDPCRDQGTSRLDA
jgi:hypothetical protein